MSLKRMLRNLKPDRFRDRNPFSEDMAVTHDVLFHERASDAQKEEALNYWIARRQPCLFGRLAASTGRLHYVILSDADLKESDLHVANKIKRERLEWKRRSLCPDPTFSEPAHGFMLVVASRKVASALPDENLYRFACRVRDLWGCPSSEEHSGTMHWETLYLKNPCDSTYVRFEFGVDFFASQGDRRWWHDHRVPGGLAFTANSIGHLVRHRELYMGLENQLDWAVQTAMETISRSAETPYGKATWLRPLAADGRPLVADVTCPFANPDKLKPVLKGMDYTRYPGHLHTDHSVRKEFFAPNASKSTELTRTQWLEDFTYLFDARKRDHARFMTGQAVSYDEVVAQLGPIEDWLRIVPPRTKRFSQLLEEQDEVERLLLKCRQWRAPSEQVESPQQMHLS